MLCDESFVGDRHVCRALPAVTNGNDIRQEYGMSRDSASQCGRRLVAGAYKGGNRRQILQRKQFLEDRLFRRIEPQEYRRLKWEVESSGRGDRELLDTTAEKIKTTLSAEPDIEIEPRVKHLFSLYRKLHRSEKSLSEIYDLLGIRLICRSVESCYRAAFKIRTLYDAIPGRFKDYIRTPKLNGYRSIHMTIRSWVEEPIEIQIRTREMHVDAETVHERYKREEESYAF